MSFKGGGGGQTLNGKFHFKFPFCFLDLFPSLFLVIFLHEFTYFAINIHIETLDSKSLQ